MKHTEQIDALEAMGLSPMKLLVGLRVLACMITLPILTVYIGTIAIAGSYLAEMIGGSIPSTLYQNDVWRGLAQQVCPIDAQDSCVRVSHRRHRLLSRHERQRSLRPSARRPPKRCHIHPAGAARQCHPGEDDSDCLAGRRSPRVRYSEPWGSLSQPRLKDNNKAAAGRRRRRCFRCRPVVKHSWRQSLRRRTRTRTAGLTGGWTATGTAGAFIESAARTEQHRAEQSQRPPSHLQHNVLLPAVDWGHLNNRMSAFRQ